MKSDSPPQLAGTFARLAHCARSDRHRSVLLSRRSAGETGSTSRCSSSAAVSAAARTARRVRREPLKGRHRRPRRPPLLLQRCPHQVSSRLLVAPRHAGRVVLIDQTHEIVEIEIEIAQNRSGSGPADAMSA
jgi:hypothetical protein